MADALYLPQGVPPPQMMPEPDQPQPMSMLAGAPQGGQRKSYEEGTEGTLEELMQLLGMDMYQEREAPFEELMIGDVPMSETAMGPGTGERGLEEALSTVPPPPGMPSPMTQDGPERPNTTAEHGLEDTMQTRMQTADPGVHPQETLDTVAQSRERLQGPGDPQAESPFGVPGGYEGKLTEGVGEAGERSFKLEGSEYGPDDRMEDRYKQEMASIKRLNEEANSNLSYSARLREYANERPHAMSFEKLNTMADQREKSGKQLATAASNLQKQLDLMVKSQGEHEAETQAAGMEAQGRLGAAQIGAQGRVGAAQARAEGGKQGDAMNRMAQLFKAYAGAEGMDEESMEQNFQQLMSLFSMMGGFQDAMGGGGLPNQ